VTFQGGTLRLFGHAASTSPDYGNFSRPMIVPEDEVGTLLTPPRYTMSAPLSGAGTLNLEVDYVRGTLSGNWSAFTGLINVSGRVANSEFRIANSAGYAGVSLFLNNNVVITRSGGSITIEIGSLGGNSGSRIGPGNSTSSGSDYRIGWKNEDAIFAGQILADGENTITKVGTGNWTLSGVNTYTGGTVVNGGTLTINNASGSGTGSGNVTVNTGATLAGTGTISGTTTINSGATISPGNDGIGTLTINSTITLTNGSTTFIQINKNAGTRDQLTTTGTINYGGTLIVTNLAGTLAQNDSFKLFNANTYNGNFSALVLPPLAPDLMWNTAALATSGTISVVSTNFTIPQALTWAGDGTANLWNTTAQTWLGTNGLPRAFVNGDTVTFNNSGSAVPPINLTTTVSPAAMTVNASQNYTLTGPGLLGGSMPLTKSGTGRLTIANTGVNTFSGGTTISAGSLQLGDGVSVNGNLPGNIVNNATFIFANPNPQTWSSVFAGNGTLVKQAAGTLTVTSTNSSYAGNVVIGGGALTLTTGAALNTGSLTLSNNGTFNFPPSSPAYFYPGSITVPANQSGTIFSPGLGNGVNGNLISGNSSSVLNISSGVSFGATTTGQFDSFAGTINILPGGELRFSPNSSGNTYGSLNPLFVIDGTLRPRNAGNTVRLGRISGSGTLSGPQSNGGAGSTTYQIGGANLDSAFTGVINSNTAVVGSLVVIHKVGTGRLTLTGANTFTGGLIVSNGAVIVNNANGSGTGLGAVTICNGATLGGNGSIAGVTTLDNGAILSPGDSIGTLTLQSTLTLGTSCTSRLELNAASITNDVVKRLGPMTYNGNLVVSNTAGTLVAGQSYKLFDATSYAGNFTSVSLPPLPQPNLYWTNRLSTDGTIAVLSSAPATPPVFTSVSTADGNLILSGTNGVAGGNYYVLSSSNITSPMLNWSRVATNQFDANGNFNVTNPVNLATPQLFYRLQLP
jgi:fibronectin-binding autotransporter adhesin